MQMKFAHTCFRSRCSGRIGTHLIVLERRRTFRVPAAGQHYKTARRQRLTGQNKDLQDLLVDPQYDALFDGGGDDPQKDPFSSGSKSNRGRPAGRNRPNEDDGTALYLKKRDQDSSDNLSGFDQDEMADHDEEEDDPSYFELAKMYQRHYFLQGQQEEVMDLHHKMRETEVPPYAQATVLAGLLEQYENLDEMVSHNIPEPLPGDPWRNAWMMIKNPDLNMDNDPLPAWIRAKRTIAANWEGMETLNGNRQRTIERIREYAELTPERQHMVDTWDPELFEGERDPEEPEVDYLDQFLALSEETADWEDKEADDDGGQAFVDELLMDMGSDDDEEDFDDDIGDNSL